MTLELDVENRVLGLSEGFFRFLELDVLAVSPEDLLGMPLRDLLPEGVATTALVEDVGEGDFGVTREWRARTHRGESRCLLAQTRRVGATSGLEIVGADITGYVERAARAAQLEERLERALSESERANQHKDQFLAHMSHEIRTPLNGVVGMLELILDTQLDAEQREFISTAKQAAESLLTIVNDVLDVAKIQSGRIDLAQENFSLHDLVRDATLAFNGSAIRKGLDFGCNLADCARESVIGDKTRLRQIVSNLVSNAIKFTDQGCVTVGAETRTGESGGIVAHLWVRDTGPGIPADKQKIVFDSFVQIDDSHARKQQGTGLGLAICAQLVKRMGGRVWVESEVGQGATFHVELTLRLASKVAGAVAEPTRAATLPPQATTIPAEGQGQRVLLVEDQAVNQRVAAAMLRGRGFNVEIANNGYEALEAIGRNPFDVVLMDVEMPGMDGLQATRAIRERERTTGGHVPIVALTAHVRQEDYAQCIANGMDGWVTKPIDRRRLIDTIAQTRAMGLARPAH
jgi:signal transduction histidine kinase/ActR/RegA family two-component response regulator